MVIWDAKTSLPAIVTFSFSNADLAVISSGLGCPPCASYLSRTEHSMKWVGVALDYRWPVFAHKIPINREKHDPARTVTAVRECLSSPGFTRWLHTCNAGATTALEGTSFYVRDGR